MLLMMLCRTSVHTVSPPNGMAAALQRHAGGETYATIEDISREIQGLYVSTKKLTNVPKYGAPSRKHISKASKQLAAAVHLAL